MRALVIFVASAAAGYYVGLSTNPPAVPAAIPEPVAAPMEALSIDELPVWDSLVARVAQVTYIDNFELASTVTKALEAAAEEFEVDVWLMASLIRVESGGNPEAVSSVGAVGLCQLMPRTAADIARKLDMQDYDLTDPATSVRMGAYYINTLLERFDGDKRAALAAYNWGPTRVASFIRKGQSIPTVYASKVLGH